MKDVLIVSLILALVAVSIVSCQKDVKPQVPQAITDTVCAPPPAVVSIANSAAGLVLPGTAAATAVDLILKGLCVSIPALNELIAFIDGLNKGMQVASAGAGLKAGPQTIPTEPLKQWRDSKKK